MNLKRSFYFSFALHMIPLLLLIFLFHGGGKSDKKGDQEGGQQNPQDFTSIIPMDKPKEDIEMSLVAPKEGDIVVKAQPTPEPSATPTPCNRWYGGIGIEYGRFDGTVGKVPRGYPAAEAGIEVGDIVLPVDEPDIRGPVGTPVKVYVIRGDYRREMTLIRGKICEEDIAPPRTGPSDGIYGIPNYSTPNGGP